MRYRKPDAEQVTTISVPFVMRYGEHPSERAKHCVNSTTTTGANQAEPFVAFLEFDVFKSPRFVRVYRYRNPNHLLIR